jgi:dTDP-4-amino-4,6-dideoxygalactose transaminase
MQNKIPFNKPYLTGKEIVYIKEVLESGLVSGDRKYTKLVQELLEKTFELPKALLTTSCSTALDMSAILLDLKEGDEVLLPSFTFVSTANAIVMRNAKPVFVDIDKTLNIDVTKIEEKITPKTKAIYPVHYAGCSCDMDKLMEIAKRHNLKVVEDAAQAVDAKYKGRYLGTIGDMGTYSFHETKNFVCGEGGALLMNDESYLGRAEIIREKGTNRSNFFKGIVDKYTWCDIGGSYLPSDILAAMLYAQIENKDIISEKRKYVFDKYNKELAELENKGILERIKIPSYNTPNHHIFYIILPSSKIRDSLLHYLREEGIGAVFHYIPLHLSGMGVKMGYKEGDFPLSEDLSTRIIRLPIFAGMADEQIDYIVEKIYKYFSK